MDVSNELYVVRHRSGIQLQKNSRSNNNDTQQTVASLLRFPCSVFFENGDGVIQKINEHNAELCGYESPHSAVGQRYYDRFSSSTANVLLNNDHHAMNKESIRFCDEMIQYQAGSEQQLLFSIKMPWYNETHQPIGLFGFCFVIGRDPLANTLALITNMGLLNTVKIQSSYPSLSKQQRVCATYLLQGLTFKEIAKKMELSPRTVEAYVNHLKDKFHCDNRTNLIVRLSEVMK